MQINKKTKSVTINRKAYQNIKRLDHGQLQTYLQTVYREGIKDGEPETPPYIRVRQGIHLAEEAIVHTLLKTRGVGEKTRERIIDGFRTRKEEKRLEFEQKEFNFKEGQDGFI